MTLAAHVDCIEANAPVRTWFGVGGGADRLARPSGEEELLALLERCAGDGPVRALGDGANLLINDAGVGGLVVSLERMARVEPLDGEDAGLVRAEAGANLPKLLVEMARAGLAGLEGLAGIPASVGGAVMMNAGGAFGSIAAVVERVRAIEIASGRVVEMARDDIAFDYRQSGLSGWIIAQVDLRLRRDDPAAVRSRLKEAMAYKKASQPLRDRSAGCVFKNPLVAGERVSAGRLIDEAGCKGMRAGGAAVSDVHANFIVTEPGARAGDVIALMERVQRRVLDSGGVALEREVVVWGRDEA